MTEEEGLRQERDRLAAELERLRADRREARQRYQDDIDRAIREHDRDMRDKEQGERMDTLNESIMHTIQRLDQIESRLTSIEQSHAKELAVNQALSDHLATQEKHTVSARTMWIAVAAIIIPVVVAIILAVLHG